MELQQFFREHKRTWAELEQLLARFEGDKSSLRGSDIDRLVHLYKKTSSQLAYAQTYYPKDEIILFLNQLTSRAHHAVYAEQWKTGNRLGDFFKRYFIGLIMERKTFILAALLLFCVGAAAGFLAVMENTLNLYVVLPAEIAENVDPHAIGDNHGDIQHAVMSTSIMTNNIRVALLAFVSGITLGIATIYLMAYNGVIIGALAALCWKAGESYVFWAYILPHGIIELTAIFIAGGAGLYMGYRMVVPGAYSRKYRLLQSIKESAQLMLGTIPLFIIAGIIEGYITPSSLSLEAKYLVSGGTMIMLVLYFIYGMTWVKRNGSVKQELLVLK